MVPLSLLHLLWMQPLCTIGPLRRIAALVTVGVRQSLLSGSALLLRGQYPKPSAPALHHPAALCTQKKIVLSPSTHLHFVESGSILSRLPETVKKFPSQQRRNTFTIRAANCAGIEKPRSPGPLLKNCEVFGNMASNRCLPVPGCAILQPTSGLCCVGRPPF